MVTRRAAELLLELAARRWPADLRDDLRREWAAELHVLAEGGSRTKMVGFAVSLAVSRAGAPLVDRSLLHRRARRTAAALLLSPIACVGIVVGSAAALYRMQVWLTGANWSDQAQTLNWTAITVAMAVLLAVFAARWARHTALDGPLRIALGVVLPIGAVAVPLLYVIYPDDLPRAVPGLLLWLAGLTLALWAAASLAARNRLRAAWWVGVLGALAAADLAVILAVVDAVSAGVGAGPVIGAQPLGSVDRISAPLWLFVAWTDWNIGLTRPTIPWGIFQIITNQVLVEPMLYLACTPYALAYAIRAGRSAPAAPVALAPTPV
ncbi:hypothetical protein [Micromonospora parathelypteridis]|uniref:Multisubunit Na+/H+ antiporter MnhF subunit n=1 Tax=Micromonospora parathelypteridis TaxID=1839617 RepID=A0A840VIP4_9ACTN|nr:hypothetical protein [Micromonospora parathelypteridis]MBB5476752.1 multisubunit Na+/H+ antiporter MnhF subunit [Micromonospora parathelypteridis]GGO16819.1 hypothetical protein GCM10011576_30100 [Micromonospora parathelypteridis]